MLDDLAVATGIAGRIAEAEMLFREVYEAYVRLYGADHPDSVSALLQLASNIFAQGRHTEAVALERQAYESRVRLSGKQGSSALLALFDLGTALRDDKRFIEAEGALAEATTGIATIYSENDIPTINARASLGHLRAIDLHRPSAGYQDIKLAADGIRARMRDVQLTPTAADARQALIDARWIFESQMEAAWDWGRAP